MAEPLEKRPLADQKIGGTDAELLQTARERYDKSSQHDGDNRDAALEDLDFLAGDMWPPEVRSEREQDKRPMLTIDRISQAVAQVVGDMRQANPAIKVRPADGVADGKIADVFTGLIRHIEAQSDASVAYVGAGESSVQCGIGHFRVVTEYSSDDTFEQNIRIKRITDAFSVTWDYQSVEITREDARYCFVEQAMDRETFRARYPDAALDSFDFDLSNDRTTWFGDWFSQEKVRVAQYWTKTPEKRTLALLVDGRTIDATDLPEVPLENLTDILGQQGSGIKAAYAGEDNQLFLAVRTRQAYRDKIEMRVINGVEVLEGPFEWPGRYIPIIPVIGEEIHIQNRTVRMGLVRRAKDPQKLYNIWRTAQTEKVALEPKIPWLVTAGNIKNYKDLWKDANRRNMPYLPYEPDKANNGVPPTRNVPQFGSSAMAEEIAVAADDMKATTKIYDPGLGNKSNETSGIAIAARQRESDTGNYIYSDNLKRALRHCGMILVDLIPKIYDSERKVRILNEDDSHDIVTINQRAKDNEGNDVLVNDITVGKYDVIVATGPAYTTLRAEAADGMVKLAQAMPDKVALFADLIVKNLDWPGADEIVDRLRKTMPPGLVKPEEGDEPMPPPQPTPEEIKAQADAKIQQDEQQRKWAETQAKVDKLEADAESSRLDNVQKALGLALQDGTLQQLIQEQVQAALAGAMQHGGMPDYGMPPDATAPIQPAPPAPGPAPVEPNPLATPGGPGPADLMQQPGGPPPTPME